MSDLEQDLRDMLTRRADATPATSGDWQDLTVRMARRNRHTRRLMAGALALVLVVGPLAGFAVARVVDDSDPGGRVTAGGPAGAKASSEIATADGNLLAMPAPFIGGHLDRLFRRTTGDGVAIRAYLNRFSASQCQGNGWCPPVDCFPDAYVVGELSTDAAIGYGSGDHFEGITEPLKVTGGGNFGTAEGSPARWTVAQVTDPVAKVRVSYAGGGSDEMAPVDGVVVLAARTDVAKDDGTVEALDSSGSVLGKAEARDLGYTTLPGIGSESVVAFGSESSSSVSGSSSGSSVSTTSPPTTTTLVPNPDAGSVPPDTGSSVSPDTSVQGPRPECEPPPPSLPAPGAQPADPAAARSEIEQAFATAYAGGLASDDAKRAVVEDSESLTGVMDEIRSGSFAAQVESATAKVTEIVFTSPTEAAVRYDINVQGSTTFPGRIGKALLIDGRWKVARVTVCADIALGSVTCPAK